MSLIEDELDIICLKELISMKNIEIPEYQRPYLWGKESVNILFNDIYNAFKENLEEYRLGSVILHKDGDKYFIVDGQQRLTTIAILLFCLEEQREQNDKNKLLWNYEYSPLSNKAILDNYAILQRRVKDLGDERERYREYLISHCSFVKIVTDSQQEAFQFFDSQNSRGKDLVPHDLLKAYHLREMNDMDSNEKNNIIKQWESINADDLESLFSTYLYPVTQWYRCRDGLYYGKKDIGQFKGINKKSNSNYAIYHKASNLFIENNNHNSKLLGIKELNQFQLTQPVIAGSRFFAYTIHYKKLLEKVKNKLEEYHKNKTEIPDYRAGDRYVKELYECALLFFADKFGLDSLKDSVFRIIYTWCYLLRLQMYSVHRETINKYVRGKHYSNKDCIKLFSYINDSCLDPDELNALVIPKQQIDDRIEYNKKKYEAIYDRIYKDNGWEENGK